jgi:thiol-disulfide isomerase/thioredoxin
MVSRMRQVIRFWTVWIALVCLFCLPGSAVTGEPVVEPAEPASERAGDGVTRSSRDGAGLVGKPAPAISLEAMIGPHDVRDLNGRTRAEKVVVLEFWATWCVPCVRSIPHWNSVVDAYGDKGVEFISISDEQRDIVERFLRKRPIRGLVGLDHDRSMFRDYAIGPIPRTVVVDRTGRVATLLGPDELTSTVLDAVLAGQPVDLPGVGGEKDPIAPPRASSPSPPPAAELPRLVDPTAAVQIVIGPAHATSTMVWTPGSIYADTRIDVQTLIERLCRLRSSAWVRWELPIPTDELRCIAKVPSPDPDMLERLAVSALAASLNLDIRREQVETDVYTLTIPDGPGPDLQPVVTRPQGHHGMHQTAVDGLLFGTNRHFEGLVEALETRLGHPVIDETGLFGKWNWGLSFDSGDIESLITGAREQLGLLLTPQRRIIEMVVIRRALPDNVVSEP